jgi:hypothetical protein
MAGPAGIGPLGMGAEEVEGIGGAGVNGGGT